MKQNTKQVILIIGPTAIGKTKLSIKLAKKFKTEIVSCDSRQFYKELKIGSAPPNANELLEVKHHFIHNLSVTEDYNAGKFESDAMMKIKELHKKYDKVIIVGGSGLYIDAICRGFDKMPKISEKTRIDINLEYQKKGLTWLQKEAKKIEPKLAQKYDIQNPHRLLRILELYKETGKKLSSFRSNKAKKRPFKIIKIGLDMKRELLYQRINRRVDNMINEGLLEEVNTLMKFRNKNALQTVGYKELFLFLEGQCTLEEAIEDIKQNTRRFAKRQITWFKRDNEITWFKQNEIMEIEKIISKL